MEKATNLIAVVVGVIISIILVGGIFVYKDQFRFEILSHNGVLGIESLYPEVKYNYTVFTEVKYLWEYPNTMTLYCELTREDLTKTTKQKTITLQKGEMKVVEFSFSNEDLKGALPLRYRVYGGGSVDEGES